MTIEEALKIVESWEKLPAPDMRINFYSAIKGYEHAKGLIEGFNARGLIDAEIVSKLIGDSIEGGVCVTDEILKLNVGEGTGGINNK